MPSEKNSELKANRKGRTALKMQKQIDFLQQAQQGNRSLDAFAASIFLKMLSCRIPPIRKTGTVADCLIPMLVNAWKNSDAKFFSDIARTIKRPQGTKDVHADPAAAALLGYILECPEEERRRTYSIDEIRQICSSRYQISARTAGRLAHAAGLKIRRKGAPKKTAHKV